MRSGPDDSEDGSGEAELDCLIPVEGQRGLALVTRSGGELIFATSLARGETALIELAEKLMEPLGSEWERFDWERIAKGCRIVEVVILEREN